MGQCDDILEQARRTPSGVRFVDLCTLAECHGWIFARSRGSHRVYKRPGTLQMMNFQEGANGMAKTLHVRQLLRAIDEE
jgi:predicted RNA binding protein YcfA (HicA-like mRNA interferase family)